MITISLERARKYLADVDPKESFFMEDGRVIRNLHELVDILEHINPKSFSYHVNSHKNDFSNWVQYVVGDIELAFEMTKTKDRQKMEDIVSARIKEIEEASHQEKITMFNTPEVKATDVIKEEAQKLLKGDYIVRILFFVVGILVGYMLGNGL